VLTGATEVEREADPEIAIGVIQDGIGMAMIATEATSIEGAAMEDPGQNLRQTIDTTVLA